MNADRLAQIEEQLLRSTFTTGTYHALCQELVAAVKEADGQGARRAFDLCADAAGEVNHAAHTAIVQASPFGGLPPGAIRHPCAQEVYDAVINVLLNPELRIGPETKRNTR